MTLRVLYLNTWGGRIYDPLMKFLPEIDADIYCLQEVMCTPQMPIDALFPESDTQYSPRVNLFSNIDAVLPEHQGYFHPFCCGFINDGQHTIEPIQYGIATFVRRTLPIMESRSEFLFGSFRKTPDPERSPMPRNVHLMRLWHPELEREFIVGHMHGLWVPSGKEDNQFRHVQAQSLVAALKSMSVTGERVVFGGDLNVLPTSDLFLQLESLGLQEQVIRQGHTDTRTSFYSPEKRHRYADYLLTSPQVEIASLEVPAQPEVSDHRPLILECA